MHPFERGTFTAVVLLSLSALAERPPLRQHAALTEADGLTPGARFLATLPSAAREALGKEGQVVLPQKPGGERDGQVRAVLRFDRPADEVFAIITRTSEQVGYVPHVTQSKTVARSEEGEATDMVVSFLFTFRYRTQHWFYPEERRMEWTLDPAGEQGLSEQSGFYQLYELDPKTTIAEYGTRVVAKDGFLNFLRGLGERGGVADALSAVRKHVATANAPARVALAQESR